jgi:hypothetical protein
MATTDLMGIFFGSWVAWPVYLTTAATVGYYVYKWRAK